MHLRRSFLSAALSSALLVGVGCRRPSDHTGPAPALPPVQVTLGTAHAEAVASSIEVTGTVRPIQRATVAAKMMGTITELPVVLGQRVRAGEVLAQLQAPEITARVLQAESQLNVVRRDLERERELLPKGASTVDLVKGLEDRFALTQAVLREAEAMVGYTTLRAPFDGVVARKLVDAGDLATPGAPLVELEGTAGFHVEAGLPDSLTEQLKIGMPIEVRIGERAVTGRLAELSSAADPAAHTVLAKIALPAETGVRSGQYARVAVPGASAARLLVPAEAVSRVGQIERVFVAGPDDRAMLRLVRTGSRRGDEVEILAGLEPGERVVVGGSELREGQRLQTSTTGVAKP